MTTNGPASVLDDDDPGDDTQLRFRYQHGYCVILLCAGATGGRPYIAIWCEHHEDLLGEKADGHFDSFQVKTATPESGPWKMNASSLCKSIGRFVELDRKFPGKFDSHSFVSNVKCYETEQADELGKSPIKFFTAVHACDSVDKLSACHAKALKELAKTVECDEKALFATCKRVRIVHGPPLDGFEASIAHEHLPKLDGCRTLAPHELDGLRDELIQTVFRASSVAVDDPSKHWCCVLGEDHLNPKLRQKRLSTSDCIVDAVAERKLVFRFAPSDGSLKLGGSKSGLKVLAKKLRKGGVVNQVEAMRARTLSAEEHLLGLVARDADHASQIIDQLKGVVQGTCSDAEAIASVKPEPWGLDMYRHVVSRLQSVAENQPDLVYRQPYDCLMGVAGLLTEECKVWWSPAFNVEEEP